MAMYANSVVGILGGGQLGRMMVEAANRYNLQVNILDSTTSTPAKQISAHDGHIDGAFSDPNAIEKLAKTVDVLTVEIEHVDTYALEKVAGIVRVEPHWQTIRTIQNKFLQKEHLAAQDVPLAEYCEVKESSVQGLQQIGRELGYPFMLKSQTQAYDGKGNCPVMSEADIPAALKTLANRPLYAEKWAKFAAELAVMVVKTQDGELSYPTVETVHEDSVCKLVYAPARNVSPKTNAAAQALARKAVAAFAGKGVFGVEMFLLPDSTILVNEIAPRPHNSGHYTIEACPVSQYDAHLRAILDMPLSQADLRLREPAVMLNILGGATSDSHLEVARAAVRVPNASTHLYGKGDARPGRKMGHITITTPSMNECERTIQPLLDLVNTLRSKRTDVPPPHPQSTTTTTKLTPTVAVIMGSDSDLPVLKPGLDLLKNHFHIPVETRITSAHRTPDWMAQYVRTAASQGIKVIIAAAGGAAHLPGMAAAYTTLPVIGVPVQGKVLDGQDAMLSMVQMPPGVPLAVMGIGNSRNAALFAARILGGEDAGVKTRYEEFVADMEEQVMGKDGKLQEVGWEGY